MKLNPETHIVATLGSKEGFANMAQAITAPGDVILTPNPTYPIHEFGFLISGASVRHLPTSNGDEFLAASPMGKVPAIVDGDVSITDDGAAIEAATISITTPTAAAPYFSRPPSNAGTPLKKAR